MHRTATFLVSISSCLGILTSSPALAASGAQLLAHIPLDGSTTASMGGETVLIGPAPRSVPGRIGEAMLFSGETVIAVPVDLSPSAHPRLTVTAWVKAGAETTSADHTIASGGGSNTPGLLVLKRASGLKSRLRGARGSVIASDFAPSDQWLFVAGTVDVPAQTLTVTQHGQTDEKTGVRTDNLYDAPTFEIGNDPDAGPRRFLFVGANSPTLQWPATGLAIDDVRLYAGVLSDNELQAIRDGAGSQGFETIDAPEGIGQGGEQGASPLPPDEDATDRQLPDREEIAEQATEVARDEALADAAQREEEARRRALEEWAEEERRRREQEQSESSGSGTYERRQQPLEGESDDADSADASGRIGGSGTGEVEPGERGEGINALRIAPGEGHRTAVAGEPWPNALTVDLETSAMHTITWYEESDRPCEVEIYGYAPGQGIYETAHAREEVCNGTGGNRRSKRTAAVNAKEAVVRHLDICPNAFSRRLKGIEISGNVVAADGSLSSDVYQDRADHPRCATNWTDEPVSCPAGQVATGLVLRFKQNSTPFAQDNYSIGGLQLICRELR